MKLNYNLFTSLFFLSSLLGKNLDNATDFDDLDISTAKLNQNILIENLNVLENSFKEEPVLLSKTKPVTNLKISDEATSKKYMLLAAASFCSNRTLDDWSCSHCKRYGDFNVYKVFKDTTYETRGFVGVDNKNKAIVISFRGSVHLYNWIQNLKNVLIPLDPKDDKIRVHQGFKQCKDALSPIYTPLVDELLKKNPDYKLIVTGHSLGGALATLVTLDLQSQLNLPWSQIELFTFGQPRVGNVEFATWFNSLNFTSTRVTSNRDIVPHLPSAIRGFVHIHNELWLNKDQAKVCSTEQFEDPTCSQSVILVSALQHMKYWDIGISYFC